MQEAAVAATDPAPLTAAFGVDVSDEASKTFVTFDLCGQTLGVQVKHVREILDQQELSRLPNASPSTEGVIDIRRETVPIFNLGDRLGLPRGELSAETRIIVFDLSFGGRHHAVGVLADRVRDVTQILPDEIEPTPALGVSGIDGRTLLGLCRKTDRLIVLLDLATVFDDQLSGAGDFGPF